MVATNKALLDCHSNSENKRLSGNVTQNYWPLEFISLESHSVNFRLLCSSCISCVTWFTMELLSVSSFSKLFPSSCEIASVKTGSCNLDSECRTPSIPRQGIRRRVSERSVKLHSRHCHWLCPLQPSFPAKRYRNLPGLFSHQICTSPIC